MLAIDHGLTMRELQMFNTMQGIARNEPQSNRSLTDQPDATHNPSRDSTDSVRGLGIGRRMLDALEIQARELGLTTLRLETNKELGEAIALYRNAGFREVAAFNDDPYAHHWFEKQLRRRS